MIPDWISRRLSLGVKRAARALAAEWHIHRRHRAGLRRASRLQLERGTVKLHLGCGPNHRDGWVNVDLFNRAADLALDFREPLPFPDDTACLIFSEHLLEHLEYPRDARHFLRECLRVLAPGGVFSVVVPDCGLAARAYAEGDPHMFELRRRRSYLREERVTLMHHLNYLLRADGLHKYGYDEETLQTILEDIGFERVMRRAFDPALDSPKRNLVGSLYMEARKPVAMARRADVA